jgi:hypothetical protein
MCYKHLEPEMVKAHKHRWSKAKLSRYRHADTKEEILLIIVLGTRRSEWSVSLSGRVYNQEWTRGTDWTWGWVGFKAGLDTEATR